HRTILALQGKVSDREHCHAYQHGAAAEYGDILRHFQEPWWTDGDVRLTGNSQQPQEPLVEARQLALAQLLGDPHKCEEREDDNEEGHEHDGLLLRQPPETRTGGPPQEMRDAISTRRPASGFALHALPLPSAQHVQDSIRRMPLAHQIAPRATSLPPPGAEGWPREQHKPGIDGVDPARSFRSRMAYRVARARVRSAVDEVLLDMRGN